ncbi:MAG: hypothetical protein ACON42_08415 [Flavobacteriaceae bacterium]
MKRKSFTPLIWSNFVGVLGLLFGICAGVLYAFGGLIIDLGVSLGWLSGLQMGTPGLSIGTLWAFGALIGMPFLFATAAWIGTFICSTVLFSFNKLLTSLKP